MVLKSFTSGVNTSFSSQLNTNNSIILTQTGLNTIRQLKDRSIIFSKNQIDGWGQIAPNTNGGWYDQTTGLYIPKSSGGQTGDTTTNPNSMLNPDNAFDENDGTSATLSISNPPGATNTTVLFGKTFAAKYIGYVKVIGSVGYGGLGFTSGPNFAALIETYNGSTWSTAFSATQSFNGIYFINATVQGIRLSLNINGTTGAGGSTSTWDIATITYGPMVDSELAYTIPSGTFPATISTAIATTLIGAWETGANIQYKLSNGSENSGWLDCATPAINSFTAFTAEPTTLTIKLIPKSSSPTAGYPAIYGAWVLAK